jgi:peptidoglycan/LPS O-acetylase OafA/YrhL
MNYSLLSFLATFSGVVAAAFLLKQTSAALRAGVIKQTQVEGPVGAFRGLLAISVFMHHQDFVRGWMETGGWGSNNRFILFLGHGAVFLFLMISGYVFWLKAKVTGGRMSWPKLVASRLRRLAPAYYFSLSLVLVQSVPPLLAAPFPVSLEFLLRTLGVGFLWWSEVPGLQTITLNGHVHFILFYQWWFYIVMPFLAWCCVGRRFPPFFILLTTLLVLAQRQLGASVWWLAFPPGILMAQIQLTEPVRRFLTDWRGGLAALGWAVGVLASGGIRWMQCELLAVVPLLWVVVSGNSLFGLLNWEPLRIIGKISYSFYLLHAIVILGMARLVRSWLAGQMPGPLAWGALVLVATILISLLSAACWRWVEEPFRKSSAS